MRDGRQLKETFYGVLAASEKGRVGEVYNLGGHNKKANIETQFPHLLQSCCVK